MEDELRKKASRMAMSNHLLSLRGDRTQTQMASACKMTVRYYSNLERRCEGSSATTMLKLYAAGVDLNEWASDAIILYKKWTKEE